jgi:hypothetical protein
MQCYKKVLVKADKLLYEAYIKHYPCQKLAVNNDICMLMHVQFLV